MGSAMSADLIYAVHGFLGCSSDWDTVKKSLPGCNFIAEDLFSKEPEKGIGSFQKITGKKIFLGYSLGGRLGLAMLKENPDLFDHYIFLSTNPGFSSTNLELREKRIQADKIWSDKINQNNWSNFLKEWNAQSVFQGSASEPKRDVERYDLQKLKESIVKRSLGIQEDFSDSIQMNNNKITWLVGDRDEKYCAIAEKMKNKKIILGYERISSGHRIWLDNPSAVVEVIKRTLLA